MNKIIDTVISNGDKLQELLGTAVEKGYTSYVLGKSNSAKIPSVTAGRNFIAYIYEVARALDDISLIEYLKDETTKGAKTKYANEMYRERKSKEIDNGIALIERCHINWISKYYAKS